eukprot:5123160-Pleurochrysis_carterae.AAC.1
MCEPWRFRRPLTIVLYSQFIFKFIHMDEAAMDAKRYGASQIESEHLICKRDCTTQGSVKSRFNLARTTSVAIKIDIPALHSY